MTNKEYKRYLKELKKEYQNFINIAEQIQPEDLSEQSESLKSKSVLSNIKLRTILQKFRKNSCGCEYK